MPLPDSRVVKLAELQEARERAKLDQNTPEITRITAEIEQLKKEVDAAEWRKVFQKAEVLKLKATFILQNETLEQINAHIADREKALEHFRETPEEDRTPEAKKEIILIEKKLEKYKLARQIAPRKSVEAIKKKKEALFSPLSPYVANGLKEPTRKAALQRLKEKIDKADVGKITIGILKEEVIRLINSKDMKKPTDFYEAGDFNYVLRMVKHNLNIELYPSYGSQIDKLENYIQNLRDEGVTEKDKRIIKTVIFRSDRSRKLRIAEQLKDQLIAFEQKTPEQKTKDVHIITAAIDTSIQENQKATGSAWLHGNLGIGGIMKYLGMQMDLSGQYPEAAQARSKEAEAFISSRGKLDDVLKELKKKIENPEPPKATPASPTKKR